MQNGIIINGEKYEAKAAIFDNRSDSCQVCAFYEKCHSHSLWITGPCALFSHKGDESKYVYFVKPKDQDDGKEK